MADDGPSNQKSDARFDHIRERIASGFPKLAGPKLDKLLLTDEIRYFLRLQILQLTLTSYFLLVYFSSIITEKWLSISATTTKNAVLLFRRA